MSTATAIEWTEATWNPTTGCDRISPGCDHCYALRLAGRLKAMGQPKYQTDGDPRTSGPGFGVALHEDVLLEPLRWRKPRVCFVDSMADLAHAKVPDWFVARVFAVMALAGRHTFQVLTKRPGRLRTLLSHPDFARQVGEEATLLLARIPARDRRATTAGWEPRGELGRRAWMPPWPLPNVWVGTSIELDRFVWRAEALRQTPASIRFLSLEPLLGPLPSLDLTGIDWVIVGGESGPGFRPLDLDWVRDIRDRCVERQVALFLKQIGGRTPKAGGRLLDGRTWDEFPAAAVAGGGTGA
jgi:protein gp37